MSMAKKFFYNRIKASFASATEDIEDTSEEVKIENEIVHANNCFCPLCVNNRECQMCAQSQRSYESLQHHMKFDHDVKHKWFCPICLKTKTFRNSQELIKHISAFHLTTNKIKPSKFQCTQCNESFFSKNLLGKHENKYHIGQVVMQLNYQLFKCDLCEESFDVINYLRNHMKSEHLDGVFSSERFNRAKLEKAKISRNINRHIHSY